MEKSNIVRFLKDSRRGVYDLIVEVYHETVISMNTTMALTLIEEDLETVAKEKIKLNYFSLNRAVTKLKRSGKVKPKKAITFEFKDDHEIEKGGNEPGKFTID